MGEPCLCVFDIDRTLTAAQHTSSSTCRDARIFPWIRDRAFHGGNLTISQLSVRGLDSTFCGRCYLGVCSHGGAGGPGSPKRAYLVDHVLVTGPHRQLAARLPRARQWSEGHAVGSPFVVHARDGTKQDTVREIVQWYAEHNITIPDWRVHFFGDNTRNVVAFKDSPFNAREVSCATRDWSRNGTVGWCGATLQEIKESQGVATCKSASSTETPMPALPPPVPAGEPCLCVFDIDRTLTAAQGSAPRACNGTETAYGITDLAYRGGTLTLSPLSTGAGLNRTFCGACYLGVCSVGDGKGKYSLERAHLEKHILATAPHERLAASLPSAKQWSNSTNVTSPFVVHKPGRSKQDTVHRILGWYASHNIRIPHQRVHFFDDRGENIAAFRGSRFNAREVSCASRDWTHNRQVGYCGATPQEIVETPGVETCADMGRPTVFP